VENVADSLMAMGFLIHSGCEEHQSNQQGNDRRAGRCGEESRCPQQLSERGDLIKDLHVGAHQRLDFLDRVDDRRMVPAAEAFADLWER